MRGISSASQTPCSHPHRRKYLAIVKEEYIHRGGRRKGEEGGIKTPVRMRIREQAVTCVQRSEEWKVWYCMLYVSCIAPAPASKTLTHAKVLSLLRHFLKLHTRSSSIGSSSPPPLGSLNRSVYQCSSYCPRRPPAPHADMHWLFPLLCRQQLHYDVSSHKKPSG